MPSNDKLSLMSAAAGGDLAGSTTRIEITSLYTTVPVTLACSLQQLRTTMFAGGSGYTATDPITAGAASFTTLAASSTLAVTGTSTLTGNVGVGGAVQVHQGNTAKLDVISVAVGTRFSALSQFTADAYGPILALAKSRGATVGTFTYPNSGDVLGQINFEGTSVTRFELGAAIIVSAASTWTSTNRETSWVFSTIPNGSVNPVTWLSVASTGAATFASSLAITGALTGVTSIAISGAATTQAAGVLSLGNTTQATVGAAGGASALPATPTGYLKTYIGATQYVIPYYAQA